MGGPILYQLMRVYPRIEAAMQQEQTQLSSAVVAHSVVGWCVERSGLDQDLAVCVRTDQHIESAFSFDIESAKAFRRELDEAIEQVVRSSVVSSGTSSVN